MFNYNKSSYGVNIRTYKAFCEIIEMKNVDKLNIIEVKDNEFVQEVVRFLYQNLKQPPQKIRRMYENAE